MTQSTKPALSSIKQNAGKENKAKITTQELFDLVKSLAILDEDNEVNLTKIANVFGKEIRTWKRNQSVIEIIEVLGQQRDLHKMDTLKSSVIREKIGKGKEQGTFTSSPELLLEFIRYCSPIIAVKMNSIINELFTKGYASMDNKQRFTLEESVIALSVAYKFEDYPEMKETLKRIVLEMAKNDDSKSEFGIKIAKAYNSFYAKISWDNNKEREDYEQRCYQFGYKPLKIISKMDMCFFGKPDRLLDFLVEFILIEDPMFPVHEHINIVKLAIKELDLYPIKDISTESLFENKKSREVFELANKSKINKRLLLN